MRLNSYSEAQLVLEGRAELFITQVHGIIHAMKFFDEIKTEGDLACRMFIVALLGAIAFYIGSLLPDTLSLLVVFIWILAAPAVACGSFLFLFYGMSHLILISPENKKTSRQIKLIIVFTLLPLFYFIDDNTMWDVVRNSFFSIFQLAISSFFGVIAYFLSLAVIGELGPPVIRKYFIGMLVAALVGFMTPGHMYSGEPPPEFKNDQIVALEAEIEKLTPNIIYPGNDLHDWKITDPALLEIQGKENTIQRIRENRARTGGLFKYIHFIISIYIGIFLSSIKKREFR